MFDPNYRAVIFRRTTPQITSPGSLWDSANKVYRLPGIDAVPNIKDLKFTFPSTCNVKFSHMEHASDKINWQGTQLSAVYFDEGTHFEEEQILYMLSRLRSDAEGDSYMRITCNPDPDHCIRRWIDWWIDKDGYPITERSGVKRYFVIAGEEWHWGDSKEELAQNPTVKEIISEVCADGIVRPNLKLITSLTFIPAKLSDNVDLLRTNPRYKASLLAMDRVEREKLLGGNWNVKPNAGDYFQREWVGNLIPRAAAPKSMKYIRYWDRAATEPNEVNKDPDWTVGLLMGKDQDGVYWILDVIRIRATSAKVRRTILDTAEQRDPEGTRVVIERDPGQAGKSEAEGLGKLLEGFDCRIRSVTKAKLTRFLPFAAAAENGNIKVCQGQWTDTYLKELESFVGDDKGKDDQVDCSSGAYNEFIEYYSIPDFILPVGVLKINPFNLARGA